MIVTSITLFSNPVFKPALSVVIIEEVTAFSRLANLLAVIWCFNILVSICVVVVIKCKTTVACAKLDAPSTLLTSPKFVQVVKSLNLVGALGILSVANLHPLLVVQTVPVENPANLHRELANLATGALKGGVLDDLRGYIIIRKTSCKKIYYMPRISNTNHLCYWDTSLKTLDLFQSWI